MVPRGTAMAHRLQRSPTARTIRSGRITFRPARGSSAATTNQDLYRIFMTGVDGTPMPSFADVIQPNDAWDLVHFLRTLQEMDSQEASLWKAYVASMRRTLNRSVRTRPAASNSNSGEELIQ